MMPRPIPGNLNTGQDMVAHVGVATQGCLPSRRLIITMTRILQELIASTICSGVKCRTVDG